MANLTDTTTLLLLMRNVFRVKKLFVYSIAGAAIFLAVNLLVLFATGDAGITQYCLNGVESRALAKRTTLFDRLALKTLYRSMMFAGQFRYPQATKFLTYYCNGRGDTLHFDAQPLLRNPEIQLALQHQKQAITFRQQPRRNFRHHIVRHTDWDLYYAFDVLFIRKKADRVAFYDQYYFQSLARKSRTPFHLGKLHFKLNDGLIHVAFPEAKMFTAYGETALIQK
jgi:hypothetical protein